VDHRDDDDVPRAQRHNEEDWHNPARNFTARPVSRSMKTPPNAVSVASSNRWTRDWTPVDVGSTLWPGVRQ
jgi:hypothetical protein